MALRWFLGLVLALLAWGAAQKPGEPAPAFTMVDAEGEPVHASDFRGAPVVINVWATWCGPCRDEMPVFQRASDELGPRLQVLLVNNREPVDTATSFLREEGITLPAVFDPTRAQARALGQQGVDVDDAASVIRSYRVVGLPSTFVIDADGVLRARHAGPVDADAFAALIQEAGVAWMP